MTRCWQNCHLSLMVVQGKSLTNPQLTPRGRSQIGSVTLTHNLEVTKINFKINRFLPFDISCDIFVSTSRHFLLNFCNVSRSIGLIAGPAPTIWKTILAKVFCFNLTIRGRYWWGANRPKTVNGSIVRCPFLSCQILHPWRILGWFSNCRTSVSRAEKLNQRGSGKPVIFDFTSSPPH